MGTGRMTSSPFCVDASRLPSDGVAGTLYVKMAAQCAPDPLLLEKSTGPAAKSERGSGRSSDEAVSDIFQ